MTHFGPMPESAGTFSERPAIIRWCPGCHTDKLQRVQLWESKCGGYEDHKYTCMTCERVHWVDGIDS